MSDVESAQYWLSWIERGNTVALVLLLGGAALQFFLAWSARPFRARVDNARQLELAHLRRDTEEAKARAADANERAAQYAPI
jgi:hypothetical protein